MAGMMAEARDSDLCGAEDLFKRELYKLSVYAYRSFYGLGLPKDVDHP